MLDTRSVVRHKSGFSRLHILENVQYNLVGPVPDRVYILTTEILKSGRDVTTSARTTCQPYRHARSIFLRISSGSVVSRPEVELLSEYGASKEAPQDPRAPAGHLSQRATVPLKTHRP